MKVKIEGLDCPNCAKALENHINKLESVKSAKINFLKSTLEFESDDEDRAVQDIIILTKNIEPDAKIITKNTKKRQKSIIFDLILLIFGISLGCVCLWVNLPVWLFWSLFAISAIMLGYKTFYKAVVLLFKGTINENLLVTISVIGATLLGEYMEGLMVIALYSIGKFLEGLVLNKSKKSIEELTNFKPEFAVVLKDNDKVKVLPSEVKVGDILIVCPGERIALDGEVLDGGASLDMQSLTGESIPKHVSFGEEVLSGAIVLDGVLKIKVNKEYEQSTVNTIINLIETASDKKSKTETFISKITKWYTLGVIVLAVVVFGLVYAITQNFNTAIYRGLIFLVVSCPCAFAISVPLSYFSGLGNASKNGILIKGSNYLDTCAKLTQIAFDKTGTITTGDFEIVEIQSYDNKYSQSEILELAGIGEQYSLHPLAKAICLASENLPQAENVHEIPGQGVNFEYGQNQYFVGKKNKNLSGTTVELFKNDKKIGQITLQDKIKPNSANAISQLKELNIKALMLTGDNPDVANFVAKSVNVDEVYANLLPEQKYEFLENLAKKDKQIVGFVGDGLNDAPALTLSNVGFCMGIKGNSASIEASDIVISNDNLEKIPTAVKISKYTRKIVWENILFSAIVKIVFLTLGAIGVTGMLSAVIADVGVTVLAILNSLRALSYKPNKNQIKSQTHSHNHSCNCEDVDSEKHLLSNKKCEHETHHDHHLHEEKNCNCHTHSGETCLCGHHNHNESENRNQNENKQHNHSERKHHNYSECE